MRRKIVVGNWKMNGRRQIVAELLQDLKTGIGALSGAVEVVVCPTYVYMAQVEEALVGSQISIGAQNVYLQDEGSFTGEVSAPMLAEFSVKYVIVGHSERRQLFSESDQQVAEKFISVQASNLTPILCLGETLQQRELGNTNSVVCDQLDAVLKLVGIEAFSQAVIAYEPVWAIGTGKTATPEQAQLIHGVIRQRLAALNQEIAENVRVLYGGSVSASNASKLFAQQDIDGGLVGGASLKATEFTSICESAG